MDSDGHDGPVPEEIQGPTFGAGERKRSFKDTNAPMGFNSDIVANALKNINTDITAGILKQFNTNITANALKNINTDITAGALKQFNTNITANALKNINTDITAGALKNINTNITAGALKQFNTNITVSLTRLNRDITASILKNFADSIATANLQSYAEASRSLLQEVGLPTGDEALPFNPTDDSRAYDVIAHHAPDVAQAIDSAAERVKTPFWRLTAIRNALAWTVYGIVLTLYVGGAMLKFPWNAIVPGVLATTGITGPSARDRVLGRQAGAGGA